MIVENGDTLINCLAYIDLNPVRARMVKTPEDYRWNTLGYLIQTDNKDHFKHKREKIPNPISGLSGVYALRRFS
jgi:hypothetical protein